MTSMNDDDDNIIGNDDSDSNDDDASENHQIPAVSDVTESGTNEPQFEGPAASPGVTGEENVFSGDATEGEAADIDAELKKVGLESDENGVKPLSSDDIDY